MSKIFFNLCKRSFDTKYPLKRKRSYDIYQIEIKKDDGYRKYPHTYSSGNEFGVTLTSLALEYTCQYRAYINDGNIQYGSEKSFTTLAAFEYSATIDQKSITTHSAVILFTFTDMLKEWGIFYSEGKPTVNDAVKKEFAKEALTLENLKSGTQYNLLPYVKDKQDKVSYFPEITFTTVKEKDVCVINGRPYVVDTIQHPPQIGDGTFYYSSRRALLKTVLLPPNVLQKWLKGKKRKDIM